MTTIWQVRLFNGPILVAASGMETRRFRSHKVGALLAYLALNLDRSCPREELYEALWPEEEPGPVANRFRVTLASLRRHLEPEGIVFGAVLDVSEPGRVRLRAQTVACDAAECERLLRSGYHSQAVALIAGPLLPGYYEEWAVMQQARYEMLLEEAVALHDRPVSRFKTETRQMPEEPLWSGQSGAGISKYALVSSHKTLLPLYLSRFFGRERELQTLQKLLQAHREVSLVGMGGMGKTRLAVEIAGMWDEECCFVSLVALSDAERLYDTVLQALGVAPQTEASIEDQLCQVLNRRAPLLVILDNAEHLSDGVAQMTLRLIASVAGLRLLVTSRERLNISGETVLLLAPLDAPGPPAQAELLLEFASVSLFVDRAKNARPDFTLSPQNAPAVAEICRQLEGIPLALELAAARITAQTPQQIAHTLQTGLTDLRSHQRGRAVRHQSLRAVVEGSLELLSQSQRDFFPALATFYGGWSVEAARTVTGSLEAEAHLHHLVLCSLVGVHENERLGSMRYALLETLRQFAAESLTPETLALFRERHARYYIAMVAGAEEEDFRFMDQLEADHENLLAAMDWYWENDQDTLTPLLTSILNLWANRGYHRLALQWIARAFPEEKLIQLVRKTGELVGFRIFADTGRYAEAERMAEVAALASEQDIIGKAWALNGLGYVRLMQGEWGQAIAYEREAIACIENSESIQVGLVRRMCCHFIAEAFLGRAEYCLDNPDPMQDFRAAEECVRTGFAEATEDSRLQSGYWRNLMCALWGQNREEEGDRCLAHALRTAIAHRHLTNLIRIFGDGAFRMAAKGFPGESVQFLSAMKALQEKMGYYAAPYFEARILKHLGEMQTLLGGETFDRYWRSGIYTPLEALISAVLPQILHAKQS